MPESIILDFSNGTASKKKSRSQRDIARYYQQRYNAFVKDGFMPEEAEWGASHGLSLRNAQVRRARSHRRASVNFYVRRFKMSRLEAMEESAKDLANKLDTAGITELNIFYEVSP